MDQRQAPQDCDAEAEQLKQLTEGMFRAVSRAKDRGFLPQRWAAANAAAARAAIERLPADRQAPFRPNIAAQLVRQKSVEDADRYIRQFQGQDGYAERGDLRSAAPRRCAVVYLISACTCGL